MGSAVGVVSAVWWTEPMSVPAGMATRAYGASIDSPENVPPGPEKSSMGSRWCIY